MENQPGRAFTYKKRNGVQTNPATSGFVGQAQQGTHLIESETEFARPTDEAETCDMGWAVNPTPAGRPGIYAAGDVTGRDQYVYMAAYGARLAAENLLEPVSRADSLARLETGAVLLLDVRPEGEFRQGRLPGAVNIPLADLEGKMALLPRDQLIVAFCGGPYCILSGEAAAVLRASGFDVRRLADGFPEWRAAGYQVE